MPGSSSDSVATGSLRGLIASMLGRHRFGAIQWLVLCGAALVIAIALGTSYLAMQFRQRALDVAEREQNNTALLLSRHFDQQLGDLQHVHNEIISYMLTSAGETADEFARSMSTLEAHEMLRAKLAAMPQPGGLHLYNAAGKLINATEIWPVPDVSIADRRYYKQFTSGEPVPEVIVEPVTSKVTGLWTMVFARKIVNRRGETIGFSSRALPPAHFENFVASLALGRATGISVIHHDGTIMARYPKNDKYVGRNVSGMPQFQRAIELKGNVSGRFIGSLGDDSIGSVRALKHFPILIVAATETSAALADWRAQTKLQFFAAVLAVVVVICMIYLIVRQLRRQHAAAQRKLSEKTQHLDTAINNMTQGLLLFDSSGRLVICNQQYIDMFGVSRDVVKPGCHLRDLILHRQQLGSFVGDIDAYCARFLDPKQGIQDIVTSTPDGRTIRMIYKRAPGRRLGYDAGRRHRSPPRPGPDRASRPLRPADQPAEPDAVPAPCGRIVAGNRKRPVRDSLYRHRRVQGHQRFPGSSDRRRIPQGRRRAASRGGGRGRLHCPPRRRRVRHSSARCERRWRRRRAGSQGLSGAANPVRLSWSPAGQRCLDRHRDRSAPRHRPVCPAQERRLGDVCREGGRPADPSLLRSGDGIRGQPPPRTRARSAHGDGRRRL